MAQQPLSPGDTREEPERREQSLTFTDGQEPPGRTQGQLGARIWLCWSDALMAAGTV